MLGKGWGIVLTGGDAPACEVIKPVVEGALRVIAADSGLDLADACGIIPDIVVGDMDSLSNTGLLHQYPEQRVRRFSHDKDETDTEIAVRALHEDGVTRIALIGGDGGRLDHLIAILSLFDRPIRPSLWLGTSDFVMSVEDEVVVSNCAGKRISFFPMGEEVCTMSSEGLQWELDELIWVRGASGVSNRITKKTMRVRMKSGRLIMVGEHVLLPGVMQ